MAKKIKISSVKGKTTKTYPLTKCYVTDVTGEDWEVTVDKKMRPSLIVEVAKDVVKLLVGAITEDMTKIKEKHDAEKPNDNNLSPDEIEDGLFLTGKLEANLNDIMAMFVLKHYTADIEIPDRETAGETLLDMLDLAVAFEDIGIFDKILELFDRDSLNRVLKKLEQEIIRVMEELTNKITEMSTVPSTDELKSFENDIIDFSEDDLEDDDELFDEDDSVKDLSDED